MAAPSTLTPALLLLVLPLPVAGQHDGHHNMQLDADGMVMNSNDSELPRGCSAISRDYKFAISASHDYASSAPGMIFGLSQHELRVEPCSRLRVTFTNQDEVRHQWMVHGLPKYLYPTGMFHLEANAGATVQGILIYVR